MTGTAELPRDLRDRLRTVRTVGAITGAGVSAESGIPTYRGRGGLYDDPERGAWTVESLSGSTLARDPDRTWRVLAELAAHSRAAQPNPAHHALARIEEKVERFVLLTQNVDGLHQRAGSRRVIDIHGDIFATRCLSCGRPGRLGQEGLSELDRAPVCSACGGILRPDAVLFGEALPLDKLERIHREFGVQSPELVIVAGTSALFPYITEPFFAARQAGNLTVEVNPERTLISEYADHALRGAAGKILPAIERALNQST